MALDYPHDTWLLDEGDDERVRRCMPDGWACGHFSRKNRPEYQTDVGRFQRRSKHGNYNAWLDNVGFDRYDVLTTFDPDHIPEPSFLRKVLGYFRDPTIGYVQLPQAYYNQKASFIARGAAEETYAFYSSVQMAGYGLGYPILIGCHNTHRMSALKELGGFACHDAEDLLMTLQYRSRGWQGVYVPEILARGLAPVDWQTYLIQQRRWARSVLDIKFRIYAHLSGKLPLKTRIASFLHGFNYLHKSFIMLGSTAFVVSTLSTGSYPGWSGRKRRPSSSSCSARYSCASSIGNGSTWTSRGRAVSLGGRPFFNMQSGPISDGPGGCDQRAAHPVCADPQGSSPGQATRPLAARRFPGCQSIRLDLWHAFRPAHQQLSSIVLRRLPLWQASPCLLHGVPGFSRSF